MHPAGEVPFDLESLARAVNYQRWMTRVCSPWLGDRVVEIGAGIGNMSRWLVGRERFIATELEPALLARLARTLEEAAPGDPRVSAQRLDVFSDDLSPLVAERLDTVVSFNVLEHIADDEGALRQFTRLVAQTPGVRRVVTVVPAHPWAYGETDRAYGHFRRYSKAGLEAMCRRVAPEANVTLRHMNAVGLPGWILSAKILKRAGVDEASITAFETLCPLLAPIDDRLHDWLHLPLGQSLVAVQEWR